MVLFVEIGQCDHFVFGFTTLDPNLLNDLRTHTRKKNIKGTRSYRQSISWKVKTFVCISEILKRKDRVKNSHSSVQKLLIGVLRVND